MGRKSQKDATTNDKGMNASIFLALYVGEKEKSLKESSKIATY